MTELERALDDSGSWRTWKEYLCNGQWSRPDRISEWVKIPVGVEYVVIDSNYLATDDTAFATKHTTCETYIRYTEVTMYKKIACIQVPVEWRQNRNIIVMVCQVSDLQLDG